MVSGLKVINSATDSIQIDENYYNMELLGYIDALTENPDPPDPGIGSIGAVKYPAGYSFIRLPNYADGSLFFINASSYMILRGAGFRTAPFVGLTYVFNAPVGTHITGYRFGKPTAGISGNQGLVVYNAAGEICFDSNKKYLRVADVITGANYRTSMPSKTLPAGKQYALAYASWSGNSYFDERDAWIGGTIYRYRMEETGLMIRMNGNTLQSVEQQYLDTYTAGFRSNYGNNYSRTFENLSYAILVADVTDY